MYKLGIIGGMGPEATELLYHKIIDKTDAKCDQEHIDTVILSHASMPDRTKAILNGECDGIINLLSEDIRLLESAGIRVIGIPCNTSHCFFDRLEKRSETIIINMIEETVKKAAAQGIKKAGIMCTDGTLKAGLYKRSCEEHGITLFEPDENTQSVIMDIIYNQIKKGERGNPYDFFNAAGYFRCLGCECIFVACTELSCVLENHSIADRMYIDALDVLADKSIELCGGKLK